jgi:hypothetical protein
MSVQTTQYVMLGNRFKYDDFYNRVQRRVATNPRDAEAELDKWRDEVEDLYYDNTHSDDIHHHQGIAIVSDGMNGEYVCVGYIIAKSNEYGDLKENPIAPSHVWDDIGDDIVRAVGFAEDIQILAFTHYT